MSNTSPPHWDDIASALESALESVDMPKGLKPMLVQAIAELRASKLNSMSEYEAPERYLD